MPTKTKFFRVATEGATTDGRSIDRTMIEQCAKNFKPEKYGARVWLEHIRGIVPGSPFDALGDVTAVEARAVEDGKLALFAQITPLPALIDLNKRGQKLYSSCEIAHRFADTGEAYLTGLAVTDSPASLGTEILKFAAGQGVGNPFAARKSTPGAVFTEAVPLALELDDGAATASAPAPASDSNGGALGKLIDLFTRMLPGAGQAASAPTAPAATPAAAATASVPATDRPADPSAATFAAALAQMGAVMQAFAATQTAQQARLDALTLQLAQTPATAGRPTATGGTGTQLADC